MVSVFVVGCAKQSPFFVCPSIAVVVNAVAYLLCVWAYLSGLVVAITSNQSPEKPFWGTKALGFKPSKTIVVIVLEIYGACGCA
jgi:hypothetical protein